MPSYTRGKKRENLFFVLVNEFLYFGFKPKDLKSLTGITDADITALGHVSVANAFGGILRVIGANAPTPHRVSKKITTASIGQQKSVSTFCGYSSVSTAQGAGWSLIKSKKGVSLKPSNTARQSLTAIATLSYGFLYCFSMDKADYEAYGAGLGLLSAANITTEAERKRLVSGSSIPYPGRASKLLSGGSTFSSFFNSDKLDDVITAGYDILSEEKVIDPGVVPFFR